MASDTPLLPEDIHSADDVISALPLAVELGHPRSDPTSGTATVDALSDAVVQSLGDHLAHRCVCPVSLLPVTTPFHAREWYRCLAQHPDPVWAAHLVHDIIYGVDIGYRGSRVWASPLPNSSPPRNFVDSAEQGAAITADLATEVALGHIAGPFTSVPWQHFRCSPLKTAPKKGSTNKFRIIHHLSHPHGRSVNTATLDWPCYLSRFDDAASIVRRLGRGCYMSKVDIKAAYRCVPVRPADWPVLGMFWDGSYYFHKTLPFGLKSSCHLWERYATAAQWCLRSVFRVDDIVHYVDDSFLAALTLSACSEQLSRVRIGMATLGMPIAEDKTELPCTRLLFLGITIDSMDMTISLGLDRVATIHSLVGEWLDRRSCSLHQLQSLIGTLSWAATVVRHGRTFLQFLRDAEVAHHSTSRRHDESVIPLSADAREDLMWWHQFLTDWNGISLLWDAQWMDLTDVYQPHTDASKEGFGAHCDGMWIHARWTSAQQAIAAEGTTLGESMPWKELYAIVVAACTWGSLWQRRRVVFYSDCMPVVLATRKGASRGRRMMQLLRALHFSAARHSFVYCVRHLAGVDNTIADDLSRVFVREQLSPATRAIIAPFMTTPVLPHIPP